MTNCLISPQEAAKEVLKRRRARKNLIDFTRYTHGRFIPAEHHFLICESLEAVASGDIKRLMVLMPPRHGKSELSSRRFPAWFLGHSPDKYIISASYDINLATDFGRDVRNIFSSQEYGNLFDTRLSKDSKASNRWHTDSGGGYYAAGLGTAITGRGAHILIIDDPVKDDVAAKSSLIKSKTYDWYKSTAYTRLESDISEVDDDIIWQPSQSEFELLVKFDGAVVLIQTRWAEDDLAGKLLEAEKKNPSDNPWHVLSFPGIKIDPGQSIEEGKALWPGKFPIKKLIDIRKNIGHRNFEALYQQNPTPEEGVFFKRAWFKRFHIGSQPETIKYITSDYAVTEDGGDFTEHGVFGVDASDCIYVLDWWHGQTDSSVWIERLLDLIEEYSPLSAYGESGVIRRSVESGLLKRSEERGVYCHFDWITRNKSKAAMAQPFRSRASMGKIYIPHGDKGDRVIDQLCVFPNGKHDDAVDACALIGLVVNNIVGKDRAIVELPKVDPDDVWGRFSPAQDQKDSWSTI